MDTEEVHICINGQDLICNKNLLLAQSNYFEALFNSNMTESLSNKVNLEDVNYESFRIILKYVETSVLAIDTNNVLKVLEIACRFLFNTIIDLCTKFISELYITADNCLMLKCFAELHSLQKLYEIADRFTKWFAISVLKSNCIINLSYAQLVDIVSCKYLNGVQEKQVLECVNNWIDHDKQTREPYFQELFQHVYLQNLDYESIDSLLQNTDRLSPGQIESLRNFQRFTTTNHGQKVAGLTRKCQQSLFMSSKAIDEPGENKDFTPQNKTFGFCCLELSGTNTRLSPINYDNYCSTKESNNQPLVGFGSAACLVGYSVYILGGQVPNSEKFIKEVWKYDLLRCSWSVETNMKSPKRHHTVAVHGDIMYVIGGVGRYRILSNEVAAYDTLNGNWSKLPDFTEAFFKLAAVVHDNKLYVFSQAVHYLDLISQNPSWVSIEADTPSNLRFNFAFSIEKSVYIVACCGCGVYRWNQQLCNYEQFRNEDSPDDCLACVGMFNDFETQRIVHRIYTVHTLGMRLYNIEYDTFENINVEDFHKIYLDGFVLCVPSL